jgi:hypothetical protein
MTIFIKRCLLFGLLVLLNACVLHPHPLYGGDYGGAYYDGGHSGSYGNHYRGDGGYRHRGRHH